MVSVSDPNGLKTSDRQRKLSYKEQKEFENLEKEIDILETEKKELEISMSSGNCTGLEIEKLSIRFSEIDKLIEEKTYRWMELSEAEK